MAAHSREAAKFSVYKYRKPITTSSASFLFSFASINNFNLTKPPPDSTRPTSKTRLHEIQTRNILNPISVKMQFTIAAFVAVLAQTALAMPAQIEDRQVPYIPCSGLYGTTQCCATDVLGLVDLDCGNPPSAPTSADNFSEVCAAIGQRARCCTLPILDQGVLCNTPSGVTD